MANVFRRFSRHFVFDTLKRNVLSTKFAIALILFYSTWVLWFGSKYIPQFLIKMERFRWHNEEFRRETNVNRKRSVYSLENLLEQDNVTVLATTSDTGPKLKTGIKPELNTNRNASRHRFYGVGCGQNPYRKRLQKLLQFWTKLTRVTGIEYFIFDGSLLGQRRNLDFIPYDHDIDIRVNKNHFPALLKLESKRPINVKDKQPHLIVPKLLEYGMRMDCNGNLVGEKVDACSIVSPVARVILGDINFIDVSLFIKAKNHTKISKFKFETSDVYPIKPCWLGRIATRCPNKPETMLEKFYGRDAVQNPSQICKNHQFLAAKLNERGKKLPWSTRLVNKLIRKKFKSKRL